MSPTKQRMRIRRWLLVTLFALPPSVNAQRDDLPAIGDIVGTLQVFGCTPSPAQFRLAAFPLNVATERGTQAVTRPVEPQVATLTSTRDPHVLSFTLPAVQGQMPYELRIQSGPGTCGRIFWESPSRGVAIAGGPPVRLVGYAVRSKIEVLGDAEDGRSARGWVGADNLDVTEPAESVRQFRWQSEIPGITGGILQVSTQQFPKQGERAESCLAPPGLLHSDSFDARARVWNAAPRVNFHALALRFAAGGNDRSGTLAAFEIGAPFYVRVVPLAGRTPLCDSIADGPAPWVLLAKVHKKTIKPRPGQGGGPPKGPDVHLGWGTTFQPSVSYSHPKLNETRYRVVRDHYLEPADVKWTTKIVGGISLPVAPKDYFGYQFIIYSDGAIHAGTTLQRGAWLYTWPGSGGFTVWDVFEAGAKLVTGVVDALGFVVNKASEIYEDAQQAVVKVATQAIQATGIVTCNPGSACEKLVQGALTTGLTAMGMPPSLPNWDELVDQGFEYMAYQVASQAGVQNVPGATELTKEVAKKLVSEAAKGMKSNRGGGGGGAMPDWLILDLGQDPAVLTLAVSRAYQPAALATNSILVSRNTLFEGQMVPLPSLWPAGTASQFGVLRIPLVLRPNNDGFTPLVNPFTKEPLDDYTNGKYARNAWREKVNNTACAAFGFQAFTGSPNLPLPTYQLGFFGVDPSIWSAFPVGSCPAQ